MKIRSIPAWLIGGTIGLLFQPMVFLAFGLPIFNGYEDAAQILALPLWSVGFALAMSDMSWFAPLAWYWLAIASLPYVLIGMLIGFLIGKLHTPRQKRLAIGGVVLLILLVIAVLIYREQQKTNEYTKTGYTVEMCEQKETEDLRINCLRQIYDRFEPDAAVCLRMQADQKMLNDCAQFVGSQTGDATRCDAFNGHQEAKDTCLEGVPQGKDDANVCEVISSEMIRFRCYNRVAMRANDFSYCYKMPMKNPYESAPSREFCIAWVTEQKYFACDSEQCKSSICREIKDPEGNGVCVWKVKQLMPQ